MKTKAFSFIEIILYVAITSMLVVVMLLFITRVVEIRAESEFDREVMQNARFVFSKFVDVGRDAAAVSTGTFGSHPGSVTFTTDAAGSIVVDTDTKTVGAETIRFVQVNTGSGPVQMTSDQVNVTNFVFNDLTRSTEPENIQLEMTLDSLDGETSVDFQTSISLRE